MAKIIMILNGNEYESLHDWESIEDFMASDTNDNEFGAEPDYSTGGRCEYRLAE